MLSFLFRFAFRLLKAALALILLFALAWFFREPLLRSAARAWIIDEAAVSADAIVVLGGGLEWRPFAAAELYRAGKSPLVLVSQPRNARTQQLLGTAPDSETTSALLKKLGVPTANILFFGEGVTSTQEEALDLRQWALDHHVRSIIIPTDPFHTRRTKWMFERVLKPAGITVTVVAVEHPAYARESWWKHEEGLVAFLNELIKSLWYRVNF